ncbi:hypothetical protein CSH63_05505 [Micromonospora tulbaghiae]|uniref:Uncharacterized protein n=1 Tax=Micromonospora tulbaghiae TaxID=479978 RepID=A0A386WES8_9ACTN|nr:hypothetical protein CSH63_05505 [Micromonospora tulbaghiae]
MMQVLIRRQPSSTSLIGPVSAGSWRPASGAQIARAARARLAKRCQEPQRGTWRWFRRTWLLAAWKASSTVQRIPAARTRWASVVGPGIQQR